MQVTVTLRVPRLPKRRPLTPVQKQAVILFASLAGVLIGAALIGRWALGLAVIADSVFGVWYALMRDLPVQLHAEVPTLETVLERARRAG